MEEIHSQNEKLAGLRDKLTELQKQDDLTNELKRIIGRYEREALSSSPPFTRNTFEFCHQCGGDGGAGGRCPRCGGNGFEP